MREHPSLFHIAFQRIVPRLRAGRGLTEARERTLRRLEAKVGRLEGAGLVTRASKRQAALEFNAMCEGLPNAELRGGTLPILPTGEEERTWRDALLTLVRGWRAAGSK